MEIKITCSGAEMVRLDELQDFQGELKSITEKKVKKLVKAMQDDGFSYPFFYWEDSDGVKYVFDGHQRQRVLEYAEEKGIRVPDEFPACKIEAKDKHDAARKLLAYNERYGVVDDEGLYKFMAAYDIDIDEISDVELPDINIGKFEADFFTDNISDGLLAESNNKIKFNILGISGMIDIGIAESFVKNLRENGAIEGDDNGAVISEVLARCLQ